MRKKRLAAGFAALGIAASLVLGTPAFATEADAPAVSAISTNDISGWPVGPEITSTAAVIMEDSTDTILYAKNMDQTLYPGAAVKIMTTFLALENSKLEDQVTMTAAGVSGVTDGGAHIGAKLDEVFTMEQCLYAIMMASANDIALQVAEHVGGSVEGFVDMMNARAAELGCTNTLFTNPTGLPDAAQYTTARDMALIMKAAINNKAFRKISKAASYTIPATNMSGSERVLANNFSMMNDKGDAFYQGCLGGKEGFTEASQSTLVCAAKRNDMTLISVVLQGASGQTDDESITTLDYGFNNFTKLSLGDDDMNLISGGAVVVPVGTGADSVAGEDVEGDETIERTYSFSGVPVGKAVFEIPEPEDAGVVIDGEGNMKAAKAFSDSRTNVPYFLIGGVGLALIGYLGYLMVRVLKS